MLLVITSTCSKRTDFHKDGKSMAYGRDWDINLPLVFTKQDIQKKGRHKYPVKTTNALL